MGYKNAPPYVQRQIDRILRKADCLTFAKAYIDDVVIFSRSFYDHLHHLERVFDAFNAYNLTVSRKKSFLAFLSIKLLGQHVDGFGLSTSEEKLEAICNLKFLETLKDLEHYLGLTGWLRCYIEYYAQLVEPLHALKTTRLKTAPTSSHSRLHFTSIARIDLTPELLDTFYAV